MVLLFWATHVDDKACQVQKKAEMLKQEIFVDKCQSHFKVENLPNPQRRVASVVYDFLRLKKQNDDACRLSPDKYQELDSILNLLKAIETSKQLMVDFISDLLPVS